MDANIIFIECVASHTTREKRPAVREPLASISDARPHHLKQIKTSFEPLDELRDELHLITNTNAPLDECKRQILSDDYVLLARQTMEAFKHVRQ